WTLVASALSANAANNTATFTGISAFDGQYMVCYTIPANTPGTALNFDGTDAYVNCGNPSNLNINGSITVEAWIKATALTGTIVSKEGSASQGYAIRCGSGGKLSFVIGTGSSWPEVISTQALPLNQWTHVAGVYNGSIMSVYINGVLSGTQSVSTSIGISSQPLYIGGSSAFSGRLFPGSIDEVCVWNVARTASQINTDMYNPLATIQTSLVGYWQFNEASGTTIEDAVGLGNGTISGTAYQWVQSLAMMVPTAKNPTNNSSSSFKANWSAPAVGTANGYNLYVATDSTFTNMLSGYNPLTTTDTFRVVTGLSIYKLYYYRVTATKTSTSGLGAYSEFKKATTINNDAAPSGNGTSGDPYQLSSLENLQWMMNNTASWSKYFILKNNINASKSSYLDNANGFNPIGNSTVNFTGNFNGQGYSIDSLCINRPTTDNVGFFGLAVGDSIKNLTLTNVNIKGQNNVGGVIGNNQGSLIKCSASGSVNATGNNAGGLAGYSTGNEDNCFARASATANQNNAGGLFGTKAGGLANQCYATGAVSSGLSTKGGIAGAISSGADIENSYWDTQTTGQALGYNTNAGTFNALGKTTAEMKLKSTFTGWNFAQTSTNASNEYWYMLSSINNAYPSHFYASGPISNAATNIGSDIATLNWNISTLGTPASTYHGVCWNTTGSPTLADSKSEFASPTVASFSANATNLIPNTTYYFRAYTRSAVDTLYSAVLSFTTFNGTKPAGDGSAANPFRIANIRNLQYLSTTPGLWNQGYTFIQTANINAAETRN
ncbi:MAG: LamG-like jellyroll fold domain-containing protein, partial [Bacteroidota bacterium]